MKLIVGLGNPGSRYCLTRHNAGKDFIQFWAASHQLSWNKEKRLSSTIAYWQVNEEKVVLAFPELYMNESGRAIGNLVENFSVNFQNDLLIIVDDFALPFGSLRIRPQGSDGGHNGLKSVQAALHSDQYSRLRLGIGLGIESTVGGQPLEDYVLQPFSPDEKGLLPKLFKMTAEAGEMWIKEPMESVMSVVNGGQLRG